MPPQNDGVRPRKKAPLNIQQTVEGSHTNSKAVHPVDANHGQRPRRERKQPVRYEPVETVTDDYGADEHDTDESVYSSSEED